MVDIPIIPDKLGIYFTGRGAFTDFLLPKISKELEDVKSKFYEGVVKAFWRINSKNTFTAMSYGSNDFFHF